MKIALPGIKGEFSNNTGEGVKRYYFELYKGLCNIGVDVDKIESSSMLGDIPSFIIENSLRNYRKYDIVHAPGIRAMKPLSAGIFGMTAHDFRPMLDRVWEQELPVGVMGRIYKELVLLGFREALKCDFLICDSSQTKDEAVELGYDKKRAFVVNLGLDYRFMSPVRHINNKNNFKVGYLGSMSKHKNIKMSINAFKLIKDPNMMFEIWGQKVMEYSNLLQLAGKDKRIIFNGFAPEVKLVEIYDTFDVFVHCVLSAGFELELLEAQARGKPVVIYKYGKVPKEVRKYCIEAEDEEHMAQIIKGLKENGYNEKQRIKAMEYARSFTWKRCAEETLKAYMKILN